MDSPQYAQLDLRVKLTHPQLLEGLDLWLRLGLISDAKVQAFCRENFTCKRPTAIAQAVSPGPKRSRRIRLTKDEQPTLTPSRPPNREKQPQVPALQLNKEDSSTQLSPQQKADWFAQLLQSLITELNVLWLMLLGVFMVVVSSGVLAATRWQYLSTAGQYGLLFVYTLVFAAVAYDLHRRPTLQLTARTLQTTTLLIIPVNFWMMDQLNLFRSGERWLMGISAAFSLTVITAVLLPLNRVINSSPIWVRLNILNSILLSWLNWGWGQFGWPTVAVHGGMVATAVLLIYEDYRQGDPPAQATQTSPTPHSELWGWLQPSRITLLGGLLILLFRALVVAQLPFSKLTVAIALGGFLLCWLGRRTTPTLWFWLGIGLLLLARGVTLSTLPLQALMISALALVIVGDRLYRRSQSVDLVCLLAIGLQSLWPWRQLVSDHFQQQVVQTATVWAATDVGMPFVLWGVGLFPYCLFILWLGGKLKPRRSGELTRVAEGLALGFGGCLTILSYVNPLTRAANFILSAITLGVIIGRRPTADPALLYLTRITGWGAVLTTINFVRPNLSLAVWAMILLVAMAGEWWVSGWSQPSSRWQQSAWHLGLVFATISYILWSNQAIPGRALWLITPLMLTGLSDRPQWQPSRLAAHLSVVALIIAQPLTFPWTVTRFLGLGMSIALMVINTRILKSAIAGYVTIGFALTFLMVAFWELPQASIGLFLGYVATITLLLWVVQDQVGRYRWGRWYGKGLNLWAWTLNSLNLLVVTVGLGVLYGDVMFLGGDNLNAYHLIGAMGLATLAIAYHHWRHPSEFSRFQIEWGVELWTASVLQLWTTSIVALAIANLVLAALSLGVDTLWVQRTQRDYRASDQWIPFIYGFWGMLLGHHSFNAVTGIYTLIFSLLVMGISRRQQSFKGLSFFALASFSWGLYELLIYQLLQAVGGSPGDGWLMFALLATVIAWCEYALAARLAWLVNLSVRDLKIIAHLHWLGASGLAFVAFLMRLNVTGGISPTGEMVWIAVVTGLAIYALLQGRRREEWIYAGILHGLAAVSYSLYLTVPLTPLLQWGSTLTCLVAIGFYHLPWLAWGWSRRPWRRVALGLPLVVTLVAMPEIGTSSLLIMGGVYVWFALQLKRPRISYLSLVFGGWGIGRILDLYQLMGMFAIAALFGGSLLYIAQIDPSLQGPSSRHKRHLLRSCATALICVVALLDSDGQFLWGLAAAGLFFAFTLSGLLLRIRAFAYIGTLFFVLKVMRQLLLFVTDHSFLLWAMGIVAGLLLIWIAATFEARRSQMTALLSYWADELRSWA